MKLGVLVPHTQRLLIVLGAALFVSVVFLLVSGVERVSAIASYAPDILLQNGGSTSRTGTAFSVEDTPSTSGAKSTRVEIFSKARPTGNTPFGVTVSNYGTRPDRFFGVNVQNVSGNSNNYLIGGGSQSYAVPPSSFRYDNVYQAWRATVTVEFAVLYRGVWQQSTVSQEGRYAHFYVSTSGADTYVSYGSSGMFNVADKAFRNSTSTDSSPAKTYYVDMAAPCSITSATRATISLRDLDALGRDNGYNSITVSVEDMTTGTAQPVSTRVGAADQNSWTNRPGMGNNETFNFSLNFLPYHIYRVKISGVVPLNILQYQLPYDPINAAITCLNYSLTPTITSPANGTPVAGDLGPRSATGRVTNGGPTRSATNINYRLTEMIYRDRSSVIPGATDSANLPCQQFRPAVGAGQYSCSDAAALIGTEAPGYTSSEAKDYIRNTSIDSEPMGTRVCFVMSIQQYNVANVGNTTNWRHSAASCFVISKKPKVNIIGGDLDVLGSAPTTISTSLTVNMTGGARANYGSWAEYGIKSGGNVVNMASGAGLAGGVTGTITNVCPTQSQLTFANNKTSGCALGGYEVDPASSRLQARFKPYTATLTAGKVIDLNQAAPSNPQYIGKNAIYGGAASGKITITGGALGKGQWVVINAPNMDVDITGNITYFGGTLSALRDIPQLVIIAKNINISEGVSRVDSWLVAAGTGTDGNLSTCSEISKDVMNRTVSGATTTAHSGSRCTAQLTVNGPVIANHVYLYRTAGSGAQKAAGEPAERFNYRPDAYLWSLGFTSGGGSVPTVMTSELPPRF